MALTTAIYKKLPVLVNRLADKPKLTWQVTYSQAINLTSSSELFREKWELETNEGAWPIANNRWESEDAEWIPLYEGKMVQSFDLRAASVVVN